MSIKKNIFSVLIGVVTIFIVGFLLFPILESIVKENLIAQTGKHYSFFLSSVLSEFIWLGIASFSGGYITSLISKTIFHSVITGALTFIMILGIGIFVNNNFSLITLMGAASSFFFCLMGGLVQKYVYILKNKNE